MFKFIMRHEKEIEELKEDFARLCREDDRMNERIANLQSDLWNMKNPHGKIGVVSWTVGMKHIFFKPNFLTTVSVLILCYNYRINYSVKHSGDNYYIMLKYKQENEADTEERTDTFLINDGKAIIIDNTFNFDNPDMQGVI